MTKQRGPNTLNGKLNCSQNSTQHGMCQERFLLLPGESKEAFDAVREIYLAQYNLNEPAVRQLVENLTERDWLQQRCTLRICKLEYQLAEAEDAGNDELIDRIEKRLASAQRYKTAAENSFKRALQMLEQFRRTRTREKHEWRLRDVAEFRATEHALVARIKNDIDIEQEMEIPEKDEQQAGPTEPIPADQTE